MALPADNRLETFQDCDRLGRQVDHVSAILFRAGSRDLADPCVQVKFRPFGIRDFALPRVDVPVSKYLNAGSRRPFPRLREPPQSLGLGQ